MTADLQELVSICEKLPEAGRAEVADFARFLLAKRDGVVPRSVVEQWLTTAVGAATTNMTTDEIMHMTRGEP